MDRFIDFFSNTCGVSFATSYHVARAALIEVCEEYYRSMCSGTDCDINELLIHDPYDQSVIAIFEAHNPGLNPEYLATIGLKQNDNGGADLHAHLNLILEERPIRSDPEHDLGGVAIMSSKIVADQTRIAIEGSMDFVYFIGFTDDDHSTRYLVRCPTKKMWSRRELLCDQISKLSSRLSVPAPHDPSLIRTLRYTGWQEEFLRFYQTTDTPISKLATRFERSEKTLHNILSEARRKSMQIHGFNVIGYRGRKP